MDSPESQSVHHITYFGPQNILSEERDTSGKGKSKQKKSMKGNEKTKK